MPHAAANPDPTIETAKPSGGSHALALALLIPAPTIGVLMAMFIAPDQWYGKTIHALAKFWLLALPVLWLLWVGRVRLGHLAPREAFRGVFRGDSGGEGRGLFDGLINPPFKGLTAGLVTGVLTLIVIIGAWELLAKNWVDQAMFAEKIASVGLSTPLIYLGFAAAITIFNALMEEYVWRWFVYERFRDAMSCLLGDRSKALIIPGAVALANLGFVLHHTIAMSLYFDPMTNALASLGIFIGGCTWSAIYLKTGNIYGSYLSHIFADIALFYVGYQIAFG